MQPQDKSSVSGPFVPGRASPEQFVVSIFCYFTWSGEAARHTQQEGWRGKGHVPGLGHPAEEQGFAPGVWLWAASASLQGLLQVLSLLLSEMSSTVSSNNTFCVLLSSHTLKSLKFYLNGHSRWSPEAEAELIPIPFNCKVEGKRHHRDSLRPRPQAPFHQKSHPGVHKTHSPPAEIWISKLALTESFQLQQAHL